MNDINKNQIWEITPINFQNAIENELSQKVYKILLKWLPYADKTYADWDYKPNCGHFFGGSFWYAEETANTVQLYATLAKLGPYDAAVTGIPRIEVKEKAIKAIRYLGFTHDTGPEDCVRTKGIHPHFSEKKWGGKNDNFFMASQTGRSVCSLGISAWILWDELDDETKILVQNVVAYYADRWSTEPARNGTYLDTQCEENGWTSQGISVALALFPKHPNYEIWKEGFIKWSINTATTYLDRLNDNPYLDAPLRIKWIHNITLHPDFTTENHAFVHPSYLCAGINLRAYHGIFGLMSGDTIYDSAFYNNENVYNRAVLRFTQFDGLAIPVQGQDWWYNRQHERQLTHSILNVFHHHPDAARFEINSLEIVERLQNSNTRGCLLEENGEDCKITSNQTAKDMENTSMQDLLTSYLIHLFGGSGVPPSDENEVAERLSGVYYYPYGSFIINRTKNSFSCFSWRNNVMALTFPNQGMWVITALFSSYVGNVIFTKSKGIKGLTNETNIRSVEDHNITRYENGFGACASIIRGDDEILQNVAFVSLPDGKTIYMELFKIKKSCQGVTIHTGMIGVRNENFQGLKELAPGVRTLYLPEYSRSYYGFYGKEPNRTETFKPISHVNVDDKIGYILHGSRDVTYINKHEYPKWKGVEDILILNDMGVNDYDTKDILQPFIVLSAPNIDHNATVGLNDKTDFMVTTDNCVLLMQTENYFVYANFNKEKTIGYGEYKIKGYEVSLFKGMNRIQNNRYSWTDELPAYSSGFLFSLYSIECDELSDCHLDISITESKIVFENIQEIPVSLTLKTAEQEILATIHLKENCVFVWNCKK